MKSNHSFGVHFYIRRDRGSKDQSPLYARIVVDSRRSELATKFKVPVKDWNSGKGMAKGRSDSLKQLNTDLEQIRAGIVATYHELLQEQKAITSDSVKARYLGRDVVKEETLCSLMTFHNESNKHTLTYGTLKNYYTTCDYLKKFTQHYFGKPDCYLSQLDFRYITEFQNYLFCNPVKTYDPLANNGLMKHLERLKKMARLAVSLQWLDRDPFEGFKLRFHKVERDFLNEAELLNLQKGKISDVHIAFVKDLFVFSCYTGLAYCDIQLLKKEHIVKGIDGGTWIYTSRQKTTIAVRIPLLDISERILQKYMDEGQPASSFIFPRITNQEVNRCLKIIAGIFNIGKNLTFHLARHTFATTVALCNGVPIETVSKILGHSKITTTQIYAKVVEMKLSMDMSALSEKLRAKEKPEPSLQTA
ncbi:MAG TPA: site-specific integrase [Chitinophaga sp.]|uniref:site-specific integrase n=1 Tax=Chitinophaga sp. TaxID=1869181 RepID=UPI002CA98AC7|nr:site-specific integrase [Chitinophaga sp.]HVI49293.1 site-specific integrase [Chitinophaga sp.]